MNSTPCFRVITLQEEEEVWQIYDTAQTSFSACCRMANRFNGIDASVAAGKRQSKLI
jgi:hypothetical protein